MVSSDIMVMTCRTVEGCEIFKSFDDLSIFAKDIRSRGGKVRFTRSRNEL